MSQHPTCCPEACEGHWRPALHLLGTARAAGAADGRAVAATIAACEKGRETHLLSWLWYNTIFNPYSNIFKATCDLEKTTQ